jgi:hypothetical protein
MAYILFIGYRRLSTHLVLRILSNPRIYIVVLLYNSLSNPNIKKNKTKQQKTKEHMKCSYMYVYTRLIFAAVLSPTFRS